MRTTLATIVLLALAFLVPAQAQQSKTQPAAPQKGAAAAPAKPKAAKKAHAASAAPAYSEMTEECGCKILNKGNKRGQICYYDITRYRPENSGSTGPDLPIYISVRKYESILWHKGGSMGFHVTGLELQPGQNPRCPKQAFDNDFKDDDNEEWHDMVPSGLPNPLAARYRCEYKTHFKWQDGKRGDPHIIIGDPTTP